MNIILTGFMGTGKSAVGRRLAKRLGWTFVEVDARIEAAAKQSIPKIFTERGEAVFRRLESRQIRQVSRGDRQVIATGGGAFVDAQNRADLQASGITICLTASPKVILKRVGRRVASRPMLAGGSPLARIRDLLQQRAPAYAQADLTVDTGTGTVEQVVDEIWEQLSSCLSPSWQYMLQHTPELAEQYAGQYVGVVANRVVASGATQLAVYRKIAQRKGDTGIYYVPLPEESLTAF